MPVGTDAVERAQAALLRLPYLSSSQRPQLEYSESGHGMLILEVVEKAAGSFDGVVGYQPGVDGESGELIGTIDLDLNNMFGTGRTSGFRWEKLGDNTEDLEFSYFEPWILNQPYNLSGTFLQEERELQGYTKTQITLNGSRHIGNLAITAGFRYDKVSADSLASSNASGLETSVTWNRIDNRNNPRAGIFYALSWSLLSKKHRFGLKETSTMDRIEVDLDHYIPTLKRQTLALLLRYRRVDASNGSLDLSDRYWIGGATSIRGYREQLFPAVKALWSSLEYRFLTGESSRFFVFVDVGHLIDYIYDSGSSTKKNAITKAGYGFGLRLQSRVGTLGFDYGLGQGDSPGQGKLHVRLSTDF
jgi:outer membrane protein insertion porin family